MPDPLSIPAGIIAIITATIQSSVALYNAIESFKNYPQRVTRLSKQLQSLHETLLSLQQLSEQDASVGVLLKLPLEECRTACDGFKELLETHRQSLRSGKTYYAWMRFRFRNGDIVDFTETLSVYKSTMAIAIADANLRTSKVTLGVLNEYKWEINTTTERLQQRLEEVLAKLDALQTPPTADEPQAISPSAGDLDLAREEKSSIEYCLQICRRYQADFERTQFELTQGSQRDSAASDSVSAKLTREMTLADITTLSFLKASSLEAAYAVGRLNRQGATAENRLLEDPTSSHQKREQLHHGQKPNIGSQTQADGQTVERAAIEKEIDSVKQLLYFCEDASSRATPERVQIVEDISAGDNSRQFCISTVGGLFKVKGAKAGDGSFQFFGSLAPEHLDQITMLHAEGRHMRNPEQAGSVESQENSYDSVHNSSASRYS